MRKLLEWIWPFKLKTAKLKVLASSPSQKQQKYKMQLCIIDKKFTNYSIAKNKCSIFTPIEIKHT